jgi:hypothetical protein
MNKIGCRRSGIGCRTSRIGCRTIRICSRTSRLGSRTSRIGCRMSKICRLQYEQDRLLENFLCKIYHVPCKTYAFPLTKLPLRRNGINTNIFKVQCDYMKF